MSIIARPSASEPTLNKVVIVTGASSGFGAEIARSVIRDGGSCVLADINEAAGTQLAKDLGDKAVFAKCDVTKLQDWRNVVKTATDAFGRVDVLVNNAGWTYSNRPSSEVTEQDFDRLFDINVRSIYHSINVLVPLLMSQGTGGSIINISSITAIRPRPGLAWYCASKGAVTAATKALAIEYAPYAIRINCISPTLSNTGLTTAFTGQANTAEGNARFQASIPLSRIGEPSDIAEAVLFLASEKSNFITGTDMFVDGGRHI